MNCVCCDKPVTINHMEAISPIRPPFELWTCWNPTCPHLYQITLDSRDYPNDIDFRSYGCETKEGCRK
jgi:hypothetical protein